MRHLSIILGFIFSSYVKTAPYDDPTRFGFPVFDSPEFGGYDAADFIGARSLDHVPVLEPKSEGLLAHKGSVVSNILSHKVNAATHKLSNVVSHKNAAAHRAKGGLFTAPQTKLEAAVLEAEDLGSKKLSIKENLQNIVSGILQPKPLVDTISEEEKYGNNGDKFNVVGKALVGGAEGVSNLVNTVLEVPGNIFKKITRTASEKLNNLGGKLIGL